MKCTGGIVGVTSLCAGCEEMDGENGVRQQV